MCSEEKTNCQQCGIEIDLYQKHFNKKFQKWYYRKDRTNKYCSEQCVGLSKQKNETRNCLFCDKKFEVPRYESQKYCSQSCSGKANINCSKAWNMPQAPKKRKVKKIICENCNEAVETTRRKYCSKKCAKAKQWENGKVEHKIKRKHRGLSRKQLVIDYKGGKCIKCGYSKCIRAMTFHHRDPSQKVFTLDQSKLYQKTWAEILIEADKCDLLCFNCHMEEHHSTG
jgi:hypothetical protein